MVNGPRLQGKRVAFAVATGVEEAQLIAPWQAVVEAGGSPVLVSVVPGEVHPVHVAEVPTQAPDIEGEDFDVEAVFGQASSREYDALVVPGGSTGAGLLLGEPEAVAFVRGFLEEGKPVAATSEDAASLVRAAGSDPDDAHQAEPAAATGAREMVRLLAGG